MADHCFEAWRAGIISLKVKGVYQNPAFDITIEACFTGPDGECIRREAYWDGGDDYRISFAPTAVGLWQYRITAPEETGVDGLTGTVECVPYTGPLDIYRHGFLRVSDDGKHLVYHDGTPFFWLGDTHWGFVAGEKWDESNHPEMDSMFRGMVDKRVKQRFTVYQTNLRAIYTDRIDSPFRRMITTHYWADGRTGELPDVTFYQQEVDKRMQYIADAGLVNAIGLDWANGILNLMPEHLRMVHYFLARYGALPLVHTIAGEAAGYLSGKPREDTIDGWREVAKEIEKTDGYHQLITAHYNTRRPFEEYYYDEDWFSFTLNQAGHGDFPIGPGDFISYRKAHPDKPFVEGESLYEACSTLEPIGSRYCTPDMMRRVAYLAMQTGGSGYTYGAQGIWDTVYEKPEKPDPMNIFNRYGITWYEAIDLPGADQLTLMREFYERVGFQRLAYSGELVQNNSVFGDPVLAELRQPVTMADAGHTVLVLYYMASTRGRFTLQDLKEGVYRAEWFDPRTGEYTAAGLLQTENGEVTTPDKPGDGDWLLKLEFAAE